MRILLPQMSIPLTDPVVSVAPVVLFAAPVLPDESVDVESAAPVESVAFLYRM